MSYNYLKAKSLKNKIKIVSIKLGQVLFELEDARVIFNHKGWMCDYIEDNDSYNKRLYKAKKRGLKITRWSCSFNDKDCFHITACKMLLKKIGIEYE